MQTVALHWHVYLLTRSPLALGALGLTRVVPIVLFSLWGGVAADRLDRRRVMFATQFAMLAGAAALSALTFTGHESLGVLYGANALLAAAAAFDNPARNALVPRLVPLSELPAALSLNLTMFHAATIGGPALAGLLIAGAGASTVAPVLASGASADDASARPHLRPERALLRRRPVRHPPHAHLGPSGGSGRGPRGAAACAA
jgi:MFS family permease